MLAYPSLARARPASRSILAASLLLLLPLQASAQLLISEFRLRGPNGASDEYVVVSNASAAPHTVASSSGTGYSVAASDGVVRFTIPNGVVIPGYGSFLGTNS